MFLSLTDAEHIQFIKRKALEIASSDSGFHNLVENDQRVKVEIYVEERKKLWVVSIYTSMPSSPMFSRYTHLCLSFLGLVIHYHDTNIVDAHFRSSMTDIISKMKNHFDTIVNQLNSYPIGNS